MFPSRHRLEHRSCDRRIRSIFISKDRELDKAFITRFDPTALKPLALERRLYGQMMLNRGTGQASTQSSLYTAYTNETNYSDVLSDVEKRISEDEEMRAKFRFWNYR